MGDERAAWHTGTVTTHVRVPRMTGMTEGGRVTPLELFFDLVFVFALTQVTRADGRRPRPGAALLRGVADPRAAVVVLVAATRGWATPCAPTKASSASCCSPSIAGDVRRRDDDPRGVRRPPGRPVRSARVRGLLPPRARSAPGAVTTSSARDDAGLRGQLLRSPRCRWAPARCCCSWLRCCRRRFRRPGRDQRRPHGAVGPRARGRLRRHHAPRREVAGWSSRRRTSPSGTG